MKISSPLPAVRDVIAREQDALPPRVQAMADAIRARHGDCVEAFLFYGSARRETDDTDKMIDFYVLVDHYRSIHGRGLRQLASILMPPSVHYLETVSDTGQRVRSKYAVMSERAFHRRTRGGAFESMLWGRFAQPALISASTPEQRDALIETLSLACQHLAHETRPLLRDDDALEQVWARGLCESYRTELRPENADGRSRELVTRFQDRYAALTRALREAGGKSAITAGATRIGPHRRLFCQAKWALRRLVGKLSALTRVIKAAFTFDAGLDYVLEKLEGHSGKRIEVTERERRRPLLHAPLLAWKILRKRALQ